MQEEINSSITLESLHEEIVNSRKHIKNYIEATEANLLLSIEEVKSNFRKLEQENLLLKKEIELLKRNQNKNNIVVFGLNKKRDLLTPEVVCEDLKELLDVDLKNTDINNVYPLGKTESCPVKIEFISYYNKKKVLQNCYKLKGKQITIAQDLTHQQREEQKTLRKHLFLAKQEKQNECYIRGNKLFVNGVAYNAEDLRETDDNHTSPKSAPSTPTIQNPKVSLKTFDTPSRKNRDTEKVPQQLMNQHITKNSGNPKIGTTTKALNTVKQPPNKPDASTANGKPRTRSITKTN